MKNFGKFLEESIRFSELPHDMQVLIGQFYEIHGQYERFHQLEHETLETQEWDVDRFPLLDVAAVEDPGDERDEHYAMNIPADKYPILVCGKDWIDGRHRVWAAKKRGQKKIQVIDLADYGLKPFGGLNRDDI